MTGSPDFAELESAWADAFIDAQRIWSPVLELPALRFCRSADDARAAGLGDGFIRSGLTERSIAVSLRRATGLGLGSSAEAVLSHTIGHLVLAPGDLGHHARLVARVRAGLGAHRRLAPLVANLWADLVVDQRLRSLGFDPTDLQRQLAPGSTSPVLRLQLRAAEILSDLTPGTLLGADESPTTELEELDLDARLVARLVHVHHPHWLAGAVPFARLAASYVAAGSGPNPARLALSADTVGAGHGVCVPAGLATVDRGERARLHPVNDSRITGERSTRLSVEPIDPARIVEDTVFRPPADYLDLLQAIGIERPRHELVAQYYRERARPFARRPSGSPTDLVLGLVAPAANHDPGRHFSTMALFGATQGLGVLRAGGSVAVDWAPAGALSRSAPWFNASEQEVLESITAPSERAGCPGIEQLVGIADLVANHGSGAEVLLVTDHRLVTSLDETEGGWALVARLGSMAPSTLVLCDTGPRGRTAYRRFLRRGWQVQHIVDWNDLLNLSTDLPDPAAAAVFRHPSAEEVMA
ncbi:MAG: hypothetical protein GY929_18365 [Actinomycetia bacterium]|nr:hypothetical protein [Actinomycetes bacterium]